VEVLAQHWPERPPTAGKAPSIRGAPSRVPLLGRGRPSLPFPHRWNYTEPIQVLDSLSTC